MSLRLQFIKHKKRKINGMQSRVATMNWEMAPEFVELTTVHGF